LKAGNFFHHFSKVSAPLVLVIPFFSILASTFHLLQLSPLSFLSYFCLYKPDAAKLIKIQIKSMFKDDGTGCFRAVFEFYALFPIFCFSCLSVLQSLLSYNLSTCVNKNFHLLPMPIVINEIQGGRN